MYLSTLRKDKIMIIEEKIKQLNSDELAKFLFDFFINFNCERIDGLCNLECSESDNSCTGCIKAWLLNEASTTNIFNGM